MIYLITYDLRKPGRDYTSLYDAIKQLGDTNHPLESVWLVAIDNKSKNAAYISSSLRNYMDDNDLIFVVDISASSHQGWLPKSTWVWLKTHN